MHGKNADHCIVKVPVGTIVKNAAGQVVGDLDKIGLMFVAARGGAGGKGNRFFCSEAEQAPKICEFGAVGEDLSYVVELRSMAAIGLVSEIRLSPCATSSFYLYACAYDTSLPKKDRSSERRQKYPATCHNAGQTQSCRLSVYHTETASRYGRIRRLRTDLHC